MNRHMRTDAPASRLAEPVRKIETKPNRQKDSGIEYHGSKSALFVDEPLAPELDYSVTDADNPSAPVKKYHEHIGAKQPHDKGRDERHRPRPERVEAIDMTEEEAEEERIQFFPDIKDHEFRIDMLMEHVADAGLEAVDLEMLIEWMKQGGRVNFIESQREQITNRFENLKALMDIPLRRREYESEIEQKTIGDAVQTCLKTFYEFFERNQSVLATLDLEKEDVSPSEQLARYLALWIGWYGKVYNSRLNWKMTKEELWEQTGLMSNFQDGLNKCLESFSHSIENSLKKLNDGNTEFRIRREINDVYRTFQNMVNRMPEETPEAQALVDEWRKSA